MKNCTCGAPPTVKRFWLGGGGMGCEYEVQCPACGKHGRAMGHEARAVEVWDDKIMRENVLHKQHIVSLQNRLDQKEKDAKSTEDEAVPGVDDGGSGIGGQ